MIEMEIRGAKQVINALRAVPKEIQRAKINALNQTATATRKAIAQELSQVTGIKRGGKGGAQQRMKIKRAKRRYPNARIIPSSSGVEMPFYRKVTAEPVSGSPTVARALIPWFGGRKVVAGFINPAHDPNKVLRTITPKGLMQKPEEAIGPSVAAAWRDGRIMKRYEKPAVRIFNKKFGEQIDKQIRKRK